MKTKHIMRKYAQRLLTLTAPLLLGGVGSGLLSGCSDEDYFGGHYVTDGDGALMKVTANINAATAQDLAWQRVTSSASLPHTVSPT